MMNRAKNYWLVGYVINYNFCKNHLVIKSTPAEMAGLQEGEGWKQLIEKIPIQ